ncbi:MAG: hypothetical protein KDI65_04865 [Alphaproteobacteria bacterium]|nr:hypothetical protein [Alphaproteobacteria bacterium]
MLRKFILIFVCMGFVYVPHTAVADTSVYELPLAKILTLVDKTKGQKRVLVVWVTKNKSSARKVVGEFADLENTMPGSVLSISDDTDPLKLREFLASVPVLPYRVYRAKKATGQNINQVLRKLGGKHLDRYPWIILLDEENNIKGEGNIYMDYIVDFILKDAVQ